MVTIGMNYVVLPGKEAAFENAFRKVITAMASIDGHGQSHMYRDIDDPRSYVILSEWTDKEAFDTFINSDSFKSVVSWGAEQILADRPKHTTYTH